MRLLLRTLFEFFLHRTSEYAACVVIALSRYMDDKELEQMADYLTAVRENR